MNDCRQKNGCLTASVLFIVLSLQHDFHILHGIDRHRDAPCHALGRHKVHGRNGAEGLLPLRSRRVTFSANNGHTHGAVVAAPGRIVFGTVEDHHPLQRRLHKGRQGDKSIGIHRPRVVGKAVSLNVCASTSSTRSTCCAPVTGWAKGISSPGCGSVKWPTVTFTLSRANRSAASFTAQPRRLPSTSGAGAAHPRRWSCRRYSPPHQSTPG